jgi:dephospho-CoA kinase
MARPLSVALTGGLATGKSHCLRAFAALGAAVIDADQVARDVVEPGTPGLAAVVGRFGEEVMAPDGRLDRSALAARVFRDPEARHDLEAIVHPLVYERIRQWAGAVEAPIAVAEIPLLYETGRARAFDRVVVAACSREEQKRRSAARGLSAGEIDQRLAAQLPIEEKRRRADYVVDTSGSAADTNRQVADVWMRLTQEPARDGFT